jgi:uncharacterized membrane-anchored protein YitT (DUF2179 family)
MQYCKLSTLWTTFMYGLVIWIINIPFFIMQYIRILRISCVLNVSYKIISLTEKISTIFQRDQTMHAWQNLKNLNKNFNLCGIYLPTHTIVAWTLYLFCNGWYTWLPTDLYALHYTLATPKNATHPNPLVIALATPISTFRYG